MKLYELINNLSDVVINHQFVQKIESIYNAKFTDELQRIISLDSEVAFYDDIKFLRGLSNDEILTATDDLHVDFVSKSLLPIFDIGDNDFIVYDYSEKVWYLYNIVDDTKFSKKNSLTEFLL